MPAVHALTGCDTVSCMFGIGQATALKELMGGHKLIELGQQGAYEDKLNYNATSFDAACYGSTVEEDMTSHRYQMRKSKIVDHNMDGMQAMMAQRCIQAHLQLVSLLHR